MFSHYFHEIIVKGFSDLDGKKEVLNFHILEGLRAQNIGLA